MKTQELQHLITGSPRIAARKFSLIVTNPRFWKAVLFVVFWALIGSFVGFCGGIAFTASQPPPDIGGYGGPDLSPLMVYLAPIYVGWLSGLVGGAVLSAAWCLWQ